jgi:hypothetical protein
MYKEPLLLPKTIARIFTPVIGMLNNYLYAILKMPSSVV